jgi:hypothetical protein
MRRVVSYCKRHLAQEAHLKETKSPEELVKTKSTRSLKNWVGRACARYHRASSFLSRQQPSPADLPGRRKSVRSHCSGERLGQLVSVRAGALTLAGPRPAEERCRR